MLDGINCTIALVIALLTTLISVYSMKYMEHAENLELYYSLYLLYFSGMIGTVLSMNLAAFFLFFELMIIKSWILVGIWGTGEKAKVAFKYFIFTEFGAMVLLAGIGATYVFTGTFDIFSIGKMTPLISMDVLVPIVSLILIGLFVKMAIFPLHNWLPDTHAEAPTPISALLSPAMIGIGGYAAIRLLYTAFPTIISNSTFILVLLLASFVTMVYGGIMAFAQDDLKRLLAYSSISQMGYMLFGIASSSIIGVTGAILIYVSHGLCKATLFMVSGIFMHNFKTRKISELRGLASKMPLTTICTVASFLGLAGVPPLIGFWGEIFVFIGGFYVSLSPFDMFKLVIAGAAVILSILTAGYGLWTVRRIFYGEIAKELEEAHDPDWQFLVPIIILVILAVVMGIYPTPLIDAISNAMKSFFP
jgi:NADH-quinone oxidoreductase subunit M